MSIYQKLYKARKLVKETKHKKTGRNEYSKYDYFTPEQVENIVWEVTEATGTICVCNLLRDEFGLYQELKLVDIETGEELTFKLATEKGEMKATNETQQMGGTDTYSERYIKMKVFQIKDNNLDFDSQDNRKTEGLSDVAFGKLRNQYRELGKMTPDMQEQYEKCSYEQKKRLADVTKDLRNPK